MDAVDLNFLPAAEMSPDVERRKSRSHGAMIAVGALIILDDGSECVVAGYDQNGQILCYPVEQ